MKIFLASGLVLGVLLSSSPAQAQQNPFLPYAYKAQKTKAQVPPQAGHQSWQGRQSRFTPTYPGPDAPLPTPGTYYVPNPYYGYGYTYGPNGYQYGYGYTPYRNTYYRSNNKGYYQQRRQKP